MPRTEEWYAKSSEWQQMVMGKLLWSNEERGIKYTQEELMDLMEWPQVILPEAGYYGQDESVTFCAGEAYVGIGVKNFKRIAACPWEASYYDMKNEAIKKDIKATQIIPLTTMGELRDASLVKILPIQSCDRVYPLMEDLWQYHPRYAKPSKTFTVGNITVKRGQTIELKNLDCDCVICNLQYNGSTVLIPLTSKGDFTIVADGNLYTLQKVYDNFTLPQRVVFEKSPPNLLTNNVLLLSETRYDVLIACCIGSLYHYAPDNMNVAPWGTNEEDIQDATFTYFPKPFDDKCPTADIEYSTWMYEADDPTCSVIMERASMFQLNHFKDVNIVIDADSDSLYSVQKCSGGKMYDYIKIHDFLNAEEEDEIRKGLSVPESAVKATENPYSEEPRMPPNVQKVSKANDSSVSTTESPYSEESPSVTSTASGNPKKKKKGGLANFLKGRNKSESETMVAPTLETHPYYIHHSFPGESHDADTKRPSKIQNLLPPFPKDSLEEDDEYINFTPGGSNTSDKGAGRGRLPLPGEQITENKTSVQRSISIKNRPLPSLPDDDDGNLDTRNEEKIISELGQAPQPQVDISPTVKVPPCHLKPGHSNVCGKDAIAPRVPMPSPPSDIHTSQQSALRPLPAPPTSPLTKAKKENDDTKTSGMEKTVQEMKSQFEARPVLKPAVAIKPTLLTPPRPPKPAKSSPPVSQSQVTGVDKCKNPKPVKADAINLGSVPKIPKPQADVRPTLKTPAKPLRQDASLRSAEIPVEEHSPSTTMLTHAGISQSRRIPTVPLPVISNPPNGDSQLVKFPPPNGNLTPLSELNPQQLATLFKYLNLESLGDLLVKNKVDGNFFEKLDDEDFAQEPFFASKFDLKQIDRIRNGEY